ncbi:LOW QUALITY PROTEIN: protein O-mannosyltransferase 1 [Leptidea sinapis]|uniref:LOW QUALITY PROTEIN: protein O-mannosyltransferase 1 n=1 Tax=Leptidea sinapis TaxID=189913 RepID=UPI0021C369C7|nr:LOW QUALITY PROTEIN: protein O-mannosyltransferase 1 [Leptidea sinapis]
MESPKVKKSRSSLKKNNDDFRNSNNKIESQNSVDTFAKEIGDAPVEKDVKQMDPLWDNQQDECLSVQRCVLRVEVDIIFLVLLSLGLFTRLYNLNDPNYIVFDELHYGRYVSLYTKGVFFFDTHPPLGKQLIYLAGQVAGYDGNFTFDKIGSPYTENVPVRALRMIPAISGSLLVATAYHFMLEICTYQWTAILAALLVLFENGFLAQSRFMLLESIQILFGMWGILATVKSTRNVGFASFVWLCFGAFSLGCCFSTKYSGFYTYILAHILVGRQMWDRIEEMQSGLRLATSALWRLTVLIVIPLTVYVSVFYAHLAMLPKAGPHDSVMTSAFQASLKGGLASITRGQPLHVAHGSQITLRHSHGRTCWLHSHAHVYPVRYADGRGSSHQQQVTCYSFKDVNNWWIVKRPDEGSLAVGSPPDVIRHGDVVQLLHGISSRALNSHDVAAPVSPQSQEVSCYIDYNVSMPAQNLWQVDIVNRDSESATWDSIRSLVRLVHVDSGSALRYSGRQLPPWGFHQHEVVADKVLTHQDTVWNVEEHRYTKAEDRGERERELVSAEMIPTAATQLVLGQVLGAAVQDGGPSTDALGHMFASEPHEWPLLQRSIAYWLSPSSNAQVHLIGNLVTWYAGTVSVLIYGGLLALYAIRNRRAISDLPPRASTRFYEGGFILFLGYWLHYLPYFFVDRTLFLHHYLPAYMFKILLLSFVIDHIYFVLHMHEKTRPFVQVFILATVVWMSYVILTFKKFSVLSYGNTDLTEIDLMNLRWKDTWDFILHKKS